MKFIAREISPQLLRASREFNAVVVTGPRRAGKTSLLRRTFPRASYHLLEDPDVLARVKADPRAWLEEVRVPAIVDEVQNAPELLPYIRTLIDRRPREKGRWLLTGSQDFGLMAGVTESMAGRAAVFGLPPLSLRELGSWRFTRGGFPEVCRRRGNPRLWFSSYLQTYLERDVRSLRAVEDLGTFRRFLSLLASRHGSMLNRTGLAAPLGLSVPTISQWISVLETTGQIIIVPPYFENFGKRLTKSPKIYWLDTGLLCHLLGLESETELERSPFVGAVFEGFVAAEILKNQVNRGGRRELYFFRDEQGLEVDFVLPGKGGRLTLIEAKWTKTPAPDMARPMLRLSEAIGAKGPPRCILVHRQSATTVLPRTLAPGVEALPAESFLRDH